MQTFFVGMYFKRVSNVCFFHFSSFRFRSFCLEGIMIKFINGHKYRFLKKKLKHQIKRRHFNTNFYSTGMKVCLIAVFVFGGD